MKLLLDTHAFVWLLAGDHRLVPTARAAISRAASLQLSAASVWEGEIKRAAGRLTAPPLLEAARRAGIAILAITAEHATEAARLPLHHRDPFDRMLVSQARLESLVLVTKDRALGRYGVPVTW